MIIVEQKSPFNCNIAVVIGINNYQNSIKTLQTAQPDAERMAQILSDQHGYQVKRFINQEATSGEIWKCLKTELPQAIKQSQARRTRLLFYFAGHGTPPKGEDGDGGFLLPQDASSQQKKAWLSMQDVLTALKDLKCHHLLVILDCCYAGAMLLASHRDVGVEAEELSKERYSRYIEESAWQIITSAAHDQMAIDILDDTRGISRDDSKHSPFAALLFNALENEAADYINDGITTATELHLYLYEKLYEQTANQTHPQISRTWTLPGYDKGEFIFQTGAFDPVNLPEALILNQENNPYRGLKSFDEAHGRFFFGRTAVIKDLQTRVSDRPLTIVLGASGSGKSSVVKAGLIPALREEPTKQWRLLEPIRPGSAPLLSLATAVLPLAVETDDLDPKLFQRIHDWLRQARKHSPNDKDLNELFSKWRRTSPDEKLLLVVEHFDLLKEWCENSAEAWQKLEDLRKKGLNSTKILQLSKKELDKIKEHIRTDAERMQLEQSMQKWKKDVEEWSRAWREDGAQFGEFIRKHCPSNNSVKQLLVIDQFEELITQCKTADRQQFLAALQAALNACPQLRLVLTLRDDFQYHFEDVDPLKSHWKASCFRVEAMRREQLREAIELPAQAQVLFFEAVHNAETETSRSLVDEILDDLGDSPGALPLLSFTLSELYYKYIQSDRQDRTFTQKNYEELGRVKKALTRRATQEYDDLANNYQDGQKIPVNDASEVKARQDMLRWVMLRMVTDDGDGRAKRRVLESDLTYGKPQKDDHRTLVIKRFVDARLLVTGKNHEGKSYVEPAHDVLVREWDKILTWLDKTQVSSTLTSQKKPWLSLRGMTRKSQPTGQLRDFDLILQRALEVAAREWDENSRKLAVDSKVQAPMLNRSANSAKQNPSNNPKKTDKLSAKSADDWLWYNNNRLSLAEEVLKSNDNWLNGIETSFVSKSIKKRDFNSRRNWLIVFGVILALSGLTIAALYQLQKAQRQRVEQLAALAKVLLSTQPVEGSVNALAAVGLSQSLLVQFPSYPFPASVYSALLESVQLSQEQNRLQHTNVVNSVAFSPDGQTIVSGCRDKSVQLWDAQTGAFKMKLTGHKSEVNFVAFSPDSQTIVSGSGDRSVRLWDAKTGAPKMELTGHTAPVISVAFSPDGQTIVSGGGTDDHSVRLWDVQTGAPKMKLTGHTDWVSSVAFSCDGTTIVSGGGNSDKSVRLWDAQTGKLKGQPLTGHTDGVSSVAFSCDGTTIVSGSYDKSVRLWDAQTGAPKGQPLTGHTDKVRSVAFSPDGQTIVSGSNDHSVRLWDAQTGAPKMKPLIGHADEVWSVAFSPDGQTIVSGSNDRSVRLWDAQTGARKMKPLIGHADAVSSVAFSPDGQTMVSGSNDHSVRLWDAQTRAPKGNPLTGHMAAVISVAFSPDGQTIVSGSNDRSVRLWNAQTGAFKTELTGHADAVSSVAFSPDNQTIVSGGGTNDRSVRLWNAQTGAFKMKLTGHAAAVSSVAFSPDSQTIVSGSNDHSVRLWNAQTGVLKMELTDHTDRVSSVAFSRDGQTIVSGSRDNSVRLWNAQTGAPKGNPLTGHTAAVNSVAFSRDGQTIVSGSRDNSVRLWNAQTGAPKGNPLTGHTATVNSVAFSPDGQTIVSGSSDHSVQLWEWDISWLGLLQIDCKQLKYHSILVKPESFMVNESDIAIAKAAEQTCKQYRESTHETGKSYAKAETSYPIMLK